MVEWGWNFFLSSSRVKYIILLYTYYEYFFKKKSNLLRKTRSILKVRKVKHAIGEKKSGDLCGREEKNTVKEESEKRNGKYQRIRALEQTNGKARHKRPKRMKKESARRCHTEETSGRSPARVADIWIRSPLAHKGNWGRSPARVADIWARSPPILVACL